MATSLIVPVLYISVLVTAMAIFSKIYRRRRAVAKTSFEPWFPHHPSRDLYISLLSDTDPTPPDNLLKSALLTRAITDVQRIWRIRDDKIALANLHTRGLVGDDTMARFAAAEKELEAEIVDVVSEANSFRTGWGQIIFSTATEMAQRQKTADDIKNMHATRISEEKRALRRAKYLGTPKSQQIQQPNQQDQITATANTSPVPAPSLTPAKVTVPEKAPVEIVPAIKSEATEKVAEGGAEAINPIMNTASPSKKANTASKRRGKKK